MNALQCKHPSTEQLTAFGLGRLDDEESAVIETHLNNCQNCRTIVEMLPNDTLLSLLQKAPPVPAHQDTPAPDPVRLAETAIILGQASAALASQQVPADLAAHPRYHILELLGTGGMGAVYKAKHRLMERQVALKVMNPSLMNRPGTVERFEREVKAVARFSHPHIVTAYDADKAGETHFLVMELVEGVSLAQRVEQQGPLPVSQACDYIRQAALGLQFAAEHGMVHRDIKPHNLMLTLPSSPSQEGNKGEIVKILDFGLARLVREEAATGTEAVAAQNGPAREAAGVPLGSLTEVGTLMGTSDFMAPEQAANPRLADSRADIYSLGCTLYYLLAGKVPFPGGTALAKLTAHREQQPVALAKLRDDIPSALAGVLDRMMAKDPAERYQTPAEVAEALRPFTEVAAALRRRVRRLVLVATSMALSFLLLAAVVIYIQTDKGEIVIEAKDDKVALVVNDKGVKIRDLATNREYQLKIGRHRLRTGEYKIDVQELPDGVQFSTERFTLNRGDSTAVVVSFNTQRNPRYLREEALGWFPADATFFSVSNMEVFPVFSQLQFIVMGENLRKSGERFWRFKDLIGPIERVSYADAENRQHPDQSRAFVRFTGSIKHNRLVDHFRQEWTGLTIEQTQSNGEPITLISDPQAGGIFGGALALIGTTDLIWAAHGPAKKHLDAVRECLELRAGRGTSLPVAQAKALQEIPANAWVYAIGEPPAPLKKHWTALLLLARSIVMSMSGTSDVEVRFRGSFSNDATAKLFLTVLNVTTQGLMKAPVVVNDPSLSAAVAKTFNTLRVDSDGDRITCTIQIPSVAFTALLEKMQDMPLEKFKDAPAANRVKEK